MQFEEPRHIMPKCAVTSSRHEGTRRAEEPAAFELSKSGQLYA